MVTGHSENSVLSKCLLAGANDYIIKPLNKEITACRIANQLKVAEAAQLQTELQKILTLQAMIVTYNHEINSPLGIAIAGLEALKDNPVRNSPYLEKVATALQKIVA
jgi:DNA-binding response OmpR family regulator